MGDVAAGAGRLQRRFPDRSAALFIDERPVVRSAHDHADAVRVHDRLVVGRPTRIESCSGRRIDELPLNDEPEIARVGRAVVARPHHAAHPGFNHDALL